MPKGIDLLRVNDANENTELALGIYDVQKDRLRLVISKKGDPRPTGFAVDPEGLLRTTLVLRRVKER